MRFYDIVLFLIIVNTFGAFFTDIAGDLGYTEFYYIDDPTAEELQELETNVQAGVSVEEVSGDDPVTYALGVIYSAIKAVYNRIFGFFRRYILWFPYLMIMFGADPTFAFGMGAIFLLIEVVGFAQIITGRSFKGIE